MNMDSGKAVRSFLAIKLPIQVIDAIEDLKGRLADAGIRARWVRPEQVHLTLRFLGDVPAVKFDSIRSCLTDVTEGVAPFSLSVQGLGVFPGIRRARVIWAGIGGETGLLEMLHARLEESLEKIGFAPETRRFSPHLTIGRMKKPPSPAMLTGAIRDCGQYSPLPFKVQGIHLIKSRLTKHGPVYSELGSVVFESPVNCY